MSTDLAEFIGAAIALNLLFGVPLFVAGLMTAVVAFGILALQSRGYRRFELAIGAMLALILLGFLYETLKIGADWGAVAGGFVPSFQGGDAVLLATGILGATVMPHVIYLHSALTQERIPAEDDGERRHLLRFMRIDVLIAMALAGVVNMLMLIVAASLFHDSRPHPGRHDRGRLPRLRHAGRRRRGARVRRRAARLRPRQLLRRHLRRPGDHAGLHRAHDPARAAAARDDDAGADRAGDRRDPDGALVISQVVLSFGIPFALVPLIWLTRRRDVMGELVNRRATTVVASLVAAAIIALNIFLLYQTFAG